MHAFTYDTHRTHTDHIQVKNIDNHLVAMDSVAPREASFNNAPRQDFINAMSVAVTGVNLVTTDGGAGRFGITVSAMSSVSADPPMLLVCINRRSPASTAILSNQVFCVNVLSLQQRNLADTFAGNASQGKPYDFSIGQWERSAIGVPRLVGATSNFECVFEHAYDAGSHTIFVGRVTTATEGNDKPLLYTRRNYGSPHLWG